MSEIVKGLLGVVGVGVMKQLVEMQLQTDEPVLKDPNVADPYLAWHLRRLHHMLGLHHRGAFQQHAAVAFMQLCRCIDQLLLLCQGLESGKVPAGYSAFELRNNIIVALMAQIRVLGQHKQLAPVCLDICQHMQGYHRFAEGFFVRSGLVA